MRLTRLISLCLLLLPLIGQAESAREFTPVTNGTYDSSSRGIISSAPHSAVYPEKPPVDDSKPSDTKNVNGSTSSTNKSNSSTTNSNESTSSSSYQSCIASIQAEIAQCASSSEEAHSSCDSENNSALQAAMSAASQSAGKTTSSSGIVTSCSNAGVMMSAGRLALSNFSSKCSSSKNSCISSCDSAKRSAAQCAEQSGLATETISYKEASDNSMKCTALQGKIDQASSAMNSLSTEIQKSDECKQELAATNSPSDDPNSAFCKAHPTVASCILDCQHPRMQNNKTCVCMQNPGSEGCGSLASASAENQFKANAPSYKTQSGAESNLKNTTTAENLLNTKIRQKNNVASTTSSQTAVGSIPALDQSSGLSRTELIAPKVAANKNAGLNSAWGDESRGGKAGPVGPPQDPAKTQVIAKANASKNALAGNQAPDLRQFLPGGYLSPKRGLAGTSGPIGPDGITGSNETNWEKMQRRYRILEISFLP